MNTEKEYQYEVKFRDGSGDHTARTYARNPQNALVRLSLIRNNVFIFSIVNLDL